MNRLNMQRTAGGVLAAEVILVLAASLRASVELPRPLAGVEFLIGRDDSPPYTCKDQCPNVAAGCYPLTPPVQCKNGTFGQVCGEFRKNRQSREKCVGDPAGPIDDCQNDIEEKYCYKFISCKCKLKNGQIKCDSAGTNWAEGGGAVSASICMFY